MVAKHRWLLALPIVAWALSLGPGCEAPTNRPTTACPVGRELFWDDGVYLHPAYGPLAPPPNAYRCAGPRKLIGSTCSGSRTPRWEGLTGHLFPVRQSTSTAVRCVSPPFTG